MQPICLSPLLSLGQFQPMDAVLPNVWESEVLLRKDVCVLGTAPL